MKAGVDCIPCIQRQIIKASRFSGLSESEVEGILRRVMEALLEEKWNKTPPELAHVAHRIVREHINGDPYAEVKRESNELALGMLPELRRRVSESAEPLRTAIRIAIAGNIIDFGAMIDFDLSRTVEEVLNKEFRYDDYDRLVEVLENADSILYFFDNAGEIAFDVLLIEQLLKIKDYHITAVVKAGPIINDATEEDLDYVGLRDMVTEIRYLSNGEQGYERSSPEVGRWIDEHDVVISKGQGNYEGLSEWKGIFYMLMVKCPVIARALNAKVGDVVLLYK
jgi:hypothetical protein